MSSILRALRKVEDEKAALGEGGVDLAHDILKRNYAQPKQTNWLLVGGAFVLLLVGIGLGWWLLPRPVPVTESGPVVRVERETAPLSVTAAPATELTATKPVPQPTVVSPPLNIAPLLPTEKVVLEPPVAEQSVEKTPVITEIELPALVIEEIVFHQDPASRLVIINELPVMVGTDIEGVRVEEILPDRVKFSYQGQRFEKLLSKE